MPKNILVISSFFIFFFIAGVAYLNSPKIDPLKNLKLFTPINPFNGFTSSFCEFRTTHPHAGLDFSTGQKNGVPVIATMDGEVRQVKITYRGHGKALYLYHKNNLLSVYAHLSKFHQSIEDYLKPFYQKNIYPGTVEISPPLKFKAGDIIAFSGETGEGYPHLHYELRKDNNPINPLPYFSFEKNSKVHVKKLIVTPESPFSSINGKFTKVALNFPIKEINIFGTFSLGIETYDSYNGNKRGIQKIELFIDNELASIFEPDTFSFDHFYGIRFIYDGSFSTFSPTRMVYNLNTQKENPFKFIQGKSFFDLLEGKHNFEIVVYGASDILRKNFFVNIKKALPKAPVLKSNIFLKSHFFLSNQSGQYYPPSINKYKVGSNEFHIGFLKPSEKFPLKNFEIMHNEKYPVPFCFYLKDYINKTQLKAMTPCLFIEPKDLALTKKIQIKVNLNNEKEKEKLGIYRLRGNLFWGGDWDGDKLSAEVFAPEDYVVLKDDIPPIIQKFYKKNNKIFVITKDIGSGIPWDGVQIKINNKNFILEYDPDHIRAEGEILEKGKAILSVKDYANNKTEQIIHF